jgi:hypothetical protein
MPRNAEARRILADLRAVGARVWVQEGRIKIVAPAGYLDAALSAHIRAFRAEILSALDGGEIVRADRSEPLPLGVVAERMWAHAQLEPESAIYSLPAAWRFCGPLDVDAFIRAFTAFVDRHESLRLRIIVRDGRPFQTFASACEASLPIEDLSSMPGPAREARLAERIETLRTQPFDLESGGPYLARFFRLAADEHVLFFMPHHVAWDGWCFDIFLRDLRELYLADVEKRAPDLPALPVQYADYALWQRRRIEDGGVEPDIAHWARRLADPPAPPALPEDRPRPELFTSDGDWTEFPIDESTLEAARALGAAERATTFMVFLSVWRAFIARLSGASDIIIGVPIQARQRAEVVDVIGCFANTLFMRHRVDPAGSLRADLAETRADCIDAYAHQEAPVELLVDRLVPRRDPARMPLAAAVFSHQQVSRRPADFGLSLIHI